MMKKMMVMMDITNLKITMMNIMMKNMVLMKSNEYFELVMI